jgi:hypothetical protein
MIEPSDLFLRPPIDIGEPDRKRELFRFGRRPNDRPLQRHRLKVADGLVYSAQPVTEGTRFALDDVDRKRGEEFVR